MFVVSSIRNYIVAKRVTFVAADTMMGEKDYYAGGHELSLKRWEYRYQQGSAVYLPYPFWSRFRVGDQVEVSVILRHPLAPMSRKR